MGALRRLLCLAAAMLLMLSGAAAQTQFVSGFDWLQVETEPLQVELTAELKAFMPLGEERLGNLNALIRHLSAQLVLIPEDEGSWGALCLSMDGEELLRLIEKRQGDAVSSMAVSGGAAVSLDAGRGTELLGQEVSSGMLHDFLQYDVLHLPPQLEELIRNLMADGSVDWELKNSAVTVSGYGKSAKTWSLVIAKEDTEDWKNRLLQDCPTGLLYTALDSITFTGRQTLTVLTDKDEALLRVTYRGNCNHPDGTKREISMTWKILRGEKIQDNFVLKTPSGGGNRNNVTVTRTIKEGKNGLSCKVSAEYNQRVGRQVTITHAEADLTQKDNAVDGTIEVSRRISGGESSKEEWTLTPSLRFSTESALCEGTLSVSCAADDRPGFAADFHLTLNPMDALRAEAFRAGQSGFEMMEGGAEALTSRFVTAFVRHAVLLPPEDTLFLSQELPGWEQVVEAAAEAARQSTRSDPRE